MSFQIAFMQLNGYTPSTYESVSTKTYVYGRTETQRTVTGDTVRLVRQFLAISDLGPEVPHAWLKLLRSVCKRHTATSGECAAGNGQDRLLYGLKFAAGDLGHPLPEYSTTKAARFYDTIELSTSHPPPVRGSHMVAFGPVTPRCVGVCYGVHPTYTFLCITSWTRGLAQRFTSSVDSALQKISGWLLAELAAAPTENLSKL
jgi:carnitine O-acetyltransferase